MVDLLPGALASSATFQHFEAGPHHQGDPNELDPVNSEGLTGHC